MSAPLALKVAVPVVAVPSVVGASYLVFFRQNDTKDSLKSLIEKEGKRIVLEDYSNNHDDIGTEIVKEYKESSITVNGISKSAPDKDQVKAYCKSTSTLTDASLLDTYRTLCSRSKLIDQVNEDLKSGNKSWLTSKITSDGTPLRNSYGTNGGTDLLIPQKGQTNATVDKGNISEDKLMEGCASVSSNPYVNKQHKDYKVAVQNCTKPATQD